MSEKQSSRIFVIGFIGSDRKGKAMEIAEEKNYRFFDLDKEIEKSDGRSIMRMCMIMGEHEYRNKEYEMLEKLSSEENIVIACGDGIIFDDMCAEILTENTVIVADHDLTCDQLWEKALSAEAPPYAFWLSSDEQEKYKRFCELYESRKPLYDKFIGRD